MSGTLERTGTLITPHGEVPVRIYTPAEADAYGLLVYFHGGAFFLGSVDTHDHVARALALSPEARIADLAERIDVAEAVLERRDGAIGLPFPDGTLVQEVAK